MGVFDSHICWCHLEFVPKVFGKPKFIIGTLPTSPVGVSTMGMNFATQTGLWKEWHIELLWRLWFQALISSPHSARLVKLSSSTFAKAPSFPWCQTETQEANVMFKKWMGASAFLLILWSLKPGDLAAPEPDPGNNALATLGHLTLSISLGPNPGLPQAREHKGLGVGE